MYRDIIVGYDGTDQAEDALALACRLAAIADGHLTLVFAYGGRSIVAQIGSAVIGKSMSEEADEVLARGLTHVPTGLRASARRLADTSPARALHELAENEHADLLVLGSTALGPVGRVTVGSVANRLLHGLPCPIAVAPQGAAKKRQRGIKRIGACWDASPESELALGSAIDLAETTGAELVILTAIDQSAYPYPTYPTPQLPDYMLEKDIGEERLAQALDRVPEGVKATGESLRGKAATALCRQAKAERLDLLVTGSRGYGPVGRVLLGGVASKLMLMAPCPVLVVPRCVATDTSAPEPALTSSVPKP